MKRLAIIAGKGHLPIEVAKTATADGYYVLVLPIEGQADADFAGLRASGEAERQDHGVQLVAHVQSETVERVAPPAGEGGGQRQEGDIGVQADGKDRGAGDGT